MNPKHKRKITRDIWTEQMGECYYCCKRMPNLDQCTLDHKMPKSRGGTSERENLVVCCASCNVKKANRDHYEFVRALVLDARKILNSRAVQSYVRKKNV